MDRLTEFAMLFKERENKKYIGVQIGTVLSPFPNIKIGLGDKIILAKDELIFAAHLLNTYKRQIEIPSTTATGATDSVTIGDHGSHSHNIENISIIGTVNFTDTLNVGDSVILIPTEDEQLFYVIDKAVRL